MTEEENKTKTETDAEDSVGKIIDGITGLVNSSMKATAKLVKSSISVAKDICNETSDFVKEELTPDEEKAKNKSDGSA